MLLLTATISPFLPSQKGKGTCGSVEKKSIKDFAKGKRAKKTKNDTTKPKKPKQPKAKRPTVRRPNAGKKPATATKKKKEKVGLTWILRFVSVPVFLIILFHLGRLVSTGPDQGPDGRAVRGHGQVLGEFDSFEDCLPAATDFLLFDLFLGKILQRPTSANQVLALELGVAVCFCSKLTIAVFGLQQMDVTPAAANLVIGDAITTVAVRSVLSMQKQNKTISITRLFCLPDLQMLESFQVAGEPGGSPSGTKSGVNVRVKTVHCRCLS